MTVKLEAKAVATVINTPETVQTVEIKPKWFKDRDYRAIYQAVSDKPTGDIADWFRIAYKKYKYRGSSNQMYDLSDIVTGLNSRIHLKGYAKDLHREHVQDKIASLASNYANVPAKETLKAIDDYSQIMAELDMNKDADRTKLAINGFLHDTEHSIPVGVKSHDYKKLDYVNSGGWYPGLFTMAAPTGVGKSSFVINLIYQIMKDPNVRIDLISLEMTAREELMRLISKDTGVSNWKLRNPHDRIKNVSLLRAVQQSAEMFNESNVHIYDDIRTLSDITSVIKANASGREPNTYICFVDYIGLIRVDNNGNIQRYQEIGEITRTFKELSNDLQFPLIELSQLNRGIEKRDDKTPMLSDLRESGSIEMDSNVVFLMNRAKDSKDLPKNQDVINVHVAKNRSGQTMNVKYLFEKNKMNFKELSNNDATEQKAKGYF